MYDYAGTTRYLFGEPYEPPFGSPHVPSIDEIKLQVASVALEPNTMRPIFSLDWMPDRWHRRLGRQQRCEIVFAESVPFHEFYDDHRKLWLNQFERVEIPLCRYAVYQLLPDVIGKSDWELERKEWSTTQGVDYLGEYPEGGLYRPVPNLNPIAAHGKRDEHGVMEEGVVDSRGVPICCAEAMAASEVCWGGFKTPGPWLVELMRDKWAEFMNGPQYRRPGEDATPFELAKSTKARIQQQEQARFDMKKHWREEADSLIAPLRPRLEGKLAFDFGLAARAAARHHSSE